MCVWLVVIRGSSAIYIWYVYLFVLYGYMCCTYVYVHVCVFCVGPSPHWGSPLQSPVCVFAPVRPMP